MSLESFRSNHQTPTHPNDRTRTQPTTAIAQMYVLAGRICQFAQIRYVIEIGSAFGAQLAPHLNGAIFLGILRDSSPDSEPPAQGMVRVVKVNFEHFLDLDDDILEKALIVWPTLDLDLSRYPLLAERMKRWLALAPYVILSHSGAMTASGRRQGSLTGDHLGAIERQAFGGYLNQVGASAFMVGQNRSSKDLGERHLMAVGGTHAVFRPQKRLKVLAIISCFNDADIIVDLVTHLIGEGVQMHFIDNWSDDGTWELLTQLAQEAPEHVVNIERFPEQSKDEHYNWHGILCRKEVIAHESPQDWFIHYDSDELRTSCWPGVPLADALSFIDSLGYNVVNHHVIDFRPTRDGFTGAEDMKSFFSHFEANHVEANANQLKAWKKQPEMIFLAPSGGHLAAFPNRQVYPLCFLLAHYSLRSTAQARKKIYQDRLPRVIKESRERRYHGHYRRYTEQTWVESSFIWDEAKLVRFDPQTFHFEFFLQRLAGA